MAARANKSSPDIVEKAQRDSNSSSAPLVESVPSTAGKFGVNESNTGQEPTGEIIEVTSSRDSDVEAGAPTSNPPQKNIGWRRVTLLLTVEAIALGALSIPSAFACLGMRLGIILTPFFGLVAVYVAYIVGQVKIKYPRVTLFPDAGRLLCGETGYWLVGFMFVATLTLLTGGHVVVGTQALHTIAQNDNVCAVLWSLIAAFLLFVCALPKHFKDFTILGIVDFVSIVAALTITIAVAGVQASQASGGLEAVPWSWSPPEDQPFYKSVLAATNIIFAFSFTICQLPMMEEMHTPDDYMKAVWTLSIVEIILYTIIGSAAYGLVGEGVSAPVLLSSSPLIARIAFGVAMPVIFISGSINIIVIGKFIEDTGLLSKVKIPQPASRRAKLAGWATMMFTITIAAWIVAELIPFFMALLGLLSSLFVSGFNFYIPGWLWFKVLKKGKWNESWETICLSIINTAIIVIGLGVFAVGSYASVMDIIEEFRTGDVKGPFTCNSTAYS